MSGKGSRPRPVDGEEYRAAWERIFRSRVDMIKRETRGMIHGITEAEAADTLTRMAQENGEYSPAHTKGGGRS